jgi:DNA-binding CsgD family transcriptional regulator
MDPSIPITRLTEREKEVLRAWLGHKTAKEIAIDLGISHHAVEKRLKLARTKLDAGSSLQAARLLAQAEGYHPTVADPADLPPAPLPHPSSQYRPIIFGGIAMSLALALALIPAGQPATEATTPAEPGEIRVDSNMAPIFDKLDENRSGYLEPPESPFVAMAFIDPAIPADQATTAVLGDSTDADQIAEFYAEADTDSDGRVSFREFHVWNSANLAKLGIDNSIVLTVRPVPES